MSSEKVETTSAGDEITIFGLDLVAFIHAEFNIEPDRDGSAPSPNIPNRKVAFWVYKKTIAIEKAIAEWNSRETKDTKKIFAFREKQFLYRNRKAKLERMA